MSYIVTILLYLLAFIILFAICHWVLMQINTKQRLRYRIVISGSISTACIFLFYLFSKGVFEFLKVSWLDALDILLVAFLLYQLYKLVRGTVAINIFIGLASIYLIWQLVKTFQLQLLSEILGQFIGVGVIILAIVFQQELRKFLIMIGRARIIKNKGIFDFNLIKENKTIPSNATYVPGEPGVLTSDHPVVKLFEDHGWTWGGHFNEIKDYHHFQKFHSDLEYWENQLKEPHAS